MVEFGSLPFSVFLIAAALLAISPGPGIAYVVSRTAAGGRNEGMASAFGTSACSLPWSW